jgi:hypothetical protein
VAVTLTAHCQLGGTFLKDPVSALSAWGLFLHTRRAVKEGTPIRLAVSLPFGGSSQVCTLLGQVRRVERAEKGSSGGLGIQLEVARMAATDRARWSLFIDNSLSA